tara:strand:+ start:3498 stop:3824 length:327 start_codon:yes stop_codon:yes gene_type:complete
MDIEPTDPNIDYRQELLDKYENFVHDEKIDDSFVDDEDKINLFETAKYIVNRDYKEYPSPMSEILIEKIYYNCIKNLDKEEYLKEREELKTKSIFELQLLKLDKFTGL